MSAWQRSWQTLDHLSDWLNPVLVREVRQSLRGRYFKLSYAITLVLAILIALTQMLVAEGDDGRDFFLAMFACLTAATCFWVPFFAFVSMGSEWEENTYDLLVLSNLTPRKIVYGKLFSAMIQSLLYFSAFVPFLVFAYLLRGINLFEIAVVIVGLFLFSQCLSLVAIGISTLSQAKFVRVSLMTGLAALLLAATIAAVGFSSLIVSVFIRDPRDVLLAVSLVLSLSCCAAFLLGEVACSRLTHPEDNCSTSLRVVTLFIVAVLMVWMGLFLQESVDADVISGFGLSAVIVVSIASLFFMSEPERLGRRVAGRVPKSQLTAILMTPLLPGGGRGVLFLILSFMGILSACGVAVYFCGLQLVEWWTNGAATVLLAMGYATVFLGLPTALAAPHSHDLRRRIVVRTLIPVLCILAFFLPALVKYLISGQGSANFRHVGNIFWTLEYIWDAPDRTGPRNWLWALGLLSLVTLLLDIRRIRHATREVLQCSRARQG